jgi:hypothetical protein
MKKQANCLRCLKYQEIGAKRHSQITGSLPFRTSAKNSSGFHGEGLSDALVYEERAIVGCGIVYIVIESLRAATVRRVVDVQHHYVVHEQVIEERMMEI